MRLVRLLALTPIFAVWTLAQATASQHLYNEHLELTQLSNHHLHADFSFNSSTPLSAYETHHYQYFPRSLAQILQSTHTPELHLRFALGRWDDEGWGARPRGGRREGGTGVEIWAWVEGHNETHIQQRWGALVNSLSGLFCASLNFIDGTKTTSPVLTFEPEGTLRHPESSKLLHALLPREVICTENLTPFLKLLPCKGKSGISSLLDGHKLFDATWQSMSIDVRTVCATPDDCRLEIEQGISIALSLPRSMRDRHDPIPRPVPIEDLECDQSKPWNAHDSCFPKMFDGEMAWTLSKVFGRSLKGSCDLGGSFNNKTVTYVAPRERSVEALGAKYAVIEDAARHYALSADTSFDLNTTKQHFRGAAKTLRIDSAILVSRQMTGHGQERGGMHSIIRNPNSEPQRIVFFESLPWFVRPFMHTLKVTGGEIEQMFYTPLIDRKRGTHLELSMTIPAHGTIVLEYEIEKAILRYTEYPPDANRGFDIGAAVVRVLDTDQYLRTTALLLPLPTPDFSMPYNVIILTSTVIALGFGSIFNLLMRRFVLAEEVPESPLAQRLKTAVQVVRELILRSKKRSAHADVAAVIETDRSSTAPAVSTAPTRVNGTSDVKKRRKVI